MAKYFLPTGFKTSEVVGKPFKTKAGQYLVNISRKCDCGCLEGTPKYAKCFKCNNTGTIMKKIKLITEEEHDKQLERQANNEKAKALLQLQRGARLLEKKKEWFAANGFDKDGYTYVLVGVDSYKIKDELKEAGWKYNSLLKWHSADPTNYEENVKKVLYSDYYIQEDNGTFAFLADAQEKANKVIFEKTTKIAFPNSNWVAECGTRIRDIEVTLVSIASFNSKYGRCQAVNFVTEDGNLLTWFTSVEIKIKEGEKCLLTGTVKKQDIYNDQKNTILTRCIIK